MNKYKPRAPLPRQIRVGKKLYTVDVVETMLRYGDMARVHYDKQKIEIGKRSSVTGKKFSANQMQDSFWHELVHAILFDMGEDALNKNEEFVTTFANRLSEAINSASFR